MFDYQSFICKNVAKRCGEQQTQTIASIVGQNEIVENHRYTPISTAEMALKEITAPEQKGKK